MSWFDILLQLNLSTKRRVWVQPREKCWNPVYSHKMQHLLCWIFRFYQVSQCWNLEPWHRTQITARFRPELYAALGEPIHKSRVIVSNQEVLDRDIYHIYIKTYSNNANHAEDCLDLSMMFLLLIGPSSWHAKRYCSWPLHPWNHRHSH